MCGIITIIRKDGKVATKQALKAYERQKTRGCEGFGFVAINEKGEIEKISRQESENEIRKDLKSISTKILSFHHRMPTSTPNFAEVAHPIRVSNKQLQFDYYVMHNGIITDCDKLKEKHKKENYNYTTEIRKEYQTSDKTYYSEMYNDSESFAIELSKAIEKNSDKINISGSIAFVCIQATKGKNSKCEKIFFGRNERNPLMLDEQKDFVRIASEHEGKLIDEHVLYSINPITNEMTKSKMLFGEIEPKYSSVCGYDLDDTDIDYAMPSSINNGKDADENDFIYDVNSEIEEMQIDMQEMETQYQLAIDRQDLEMIDEIENAMQDLAIEIKLKKQNRNTSFMKSICNG